jgi:hypothetical protein
MALSQESFSDLLFVLYLTNSVCNRHDKFSQSFVTGPWEFPLKAISTFGLDYLEPIPHAVF